MWPFSKKLDFTYYLPVPFEIDLRARLPRNGLRNLKVLNVGVGEGNSGLAVQLPYFPFARLDNIDVHQPYLEAAMARTWAAKEVNFFHADIKNFNIVGYDLVLMFDVLEHLTKADSLAIINRIKCRQVIFIPLEKEFRKNVYGAKSQDHLSLWTEADFKGRGYKTEVLKDFHHKDNRIFDALWAVK